jgi:hypothetical protein
MHGDRVMNKNKSPSKEEQKEAAPVHADDEKSSNTIIGKNGEVVKSPWDDEPAEESEKKMKKEEEKEEKKIKKEEEKEEKKMKKDEEKEEKKLEKEVKKDASTESKKEGTEVI